MSSSRTFLLTTAGIAWLSSTSALAGARPAALELKRLADQSQREFDPEAKDFLFRMTRAQHFWMESREERRPSGRPDFASVVKKEPRKYKCKHPLREVATLGSDHYGLVLDSTDFESKGYDRLYFDRNRNGDLTDDPVIKPKPTSSERSAGPRRKYSEFPRVDLAVNADGKKMDYAFFFTSYVYFERENASAFSVRASLNAAAYRDGEVVLNGRSRRVVLIDYNSNGRFDDAWMIDPNVRMHDGTIYPRSGDMLLIDPDTSDATYLGYGVTDRSERQLVSPLVCVDGWFYDLQVSPTGDTVALTPSPRPLGAVTNPNPEFDVVLYSDMGMVKICGGQAMSVALPAGDWKLVQYTIKAPKPEEPTVILAQASVDRDADPRRPRFTLVSAKATVDCPSVTVHKSKVCDLPLGPPYKPVVKVSYVRPAKDRDSGPAAQLELRIVGTAGEICDNALLDGDRPRPPSFKITTAKGKSVHSGKFEYG